MPEHLAPAQYAASVYAKAITSIGAAVLVVLGAGLTDGVLTPVELINSGIALVTSVGVYAVPNAPTGAQAYAKAAVAFLGAALAALVLVITSGVSPSEWITVVLAALGAIGVTVIPNTPVLIEHEDLSSTPL